MIVGFRFCFRYVGLFFVLLFTIVIVRLWIFPLIYSIQISSF